MSLLDAASKGAFYSVGWLRRSGETPRGKAKHCPTNFNKGIMEDKDKIKVIRLETPQDRKAREDRKANGCADAADCVWEAPEGAFNFPEGVAVQYVLVEKAPPIGNKEYLGDSIYIEEGSYKGELILTTENGFGPSNTIVFGPAEMDALFNYVNKVRG